jgi:site-specific DNA recombinase
MKKRVWTLYRVSTDRQHDGNDIPMQKNACHEFISRQKDWVLENEIMELGVSGYKKSAKERDALEQIRKGAVEKKFDVLLVFMFDRLGRKQDETPFVVEGLTKLGIEVWSVVEGQRKIEEHIDNLINYITFWQAAGESRKTSQRVTEALSQMNSSGQFTGGTIPYGYKLVDTDIKHPKKDKMIKDLEVDENESKLIKIIFDLVIDKGFGATRIAQWLNQNGYKTRNGSPWRHNYISRILRNKIYCGYKMYGYYDDNNRIQKDKLKLQPYNEKYRIIPQEQFDLVQKIIDSRNVTKEIDEDDTSSPTKSSILLSGICYCGYCGKKLVTDYSIKSWVRKTDGQVSKWKTYRYICKHGKDQTVEHMAKQFGAKKYDYEAEQYAFKIMERVNTQGLVRAKDKRKNEILNAKKSLIAQLINELKEEKDELEAIKRILIRAEMGKSQISVEQAEIMLNEQQNKIDEKQQLIDKIKNEINEVEKELNTQYKLEEESVNWKERYESADIEEKKMMLSRVFKKVILKKDEIEYELSDSLKAFMDG